jgi:Ca-activated chloride channel homolog
VPPDKFAEAAAALGIRLYTIGVGRGGMVPSYTLDRQGDIVRNRLGRPDISTQDFPLDETMLKAMAEKANGRYYRARDIRDLQGIYADIDRLEKTKVNLSFRTEYEEKWQWPLLAGLALLMLEQLLAWTKLRTLP